MPKRIDNGCSQLYRFLLCFLNVVIFIMGLLVCILAAVLRWGSKFDGLGKISELTKDLVGIVKISSVTYLVLSIGVFALVLSLVGLLGLWYLNKCLLMFYEVIIVILFLTHGIGLLVLLFARNGIENEFEKALVKINDNIYKNDTKQNDFKVSCDAMKTLSTLFTCCGSKSPSMLQKQDFIDHCCDLTKHKFLVTDNATTFGCSKNVVNEIEHKAKSFIIIPSGVILLVELIVIIVTPLLISDIKNSAY